MLSYVQTCNQVDALTATWRYLNNQVPTDQVAVAQVNVDLVVLCERKSAIGINSPATDSELAIDRLSAAIDSLNTMMENNEAANNIMNGVSTIMNQ